MYNYIVTAHKPSTVLGAVTGSFTSPDVTNLITHKLTRIEIYVVAPEGLKSVMDFPVYGRIASMQLYHPQGRKTGLLFVATESYKFFVISFDSKEQSIVTESCGDIQDRVGTPAETGQICIIDPACRLIGLYLYQGSFKVIPMETMASIKKRLVIKGHQPSNKEPGKLRDAFNIRLPELQPQCMALLYNTEQPTLVIVYQDVNHRRHLKTYHINIKDQEFLDGPFELKDIGNVLAIAAVPKGGLLVLSDVWIRYYNEDFVVKELALPEVMSLRVTGLVDDDGSRYLVGDDKGSLYLLVLSDNQEELKLMFLGKVSLPHCIAYLDNGYAFVGSHLNDSLLIKLLSTANEHGWFLDVIERFTNLAPITDFCVVDLERQGQGQIVTCSGAFQDGTLRIIRNGVGITEQATLEMRGIRGIWSLRQGFDDTHDNTLVISFINETRVLTMTDAEEMQEVEKFSQFDMDKITICTGNMDGNLLVQVTEDSIRLIDSKNQNITSEWFPSPTDSKITVASVNPSQVVISIGGGILVYFEVRKQELVEVARTKFEHEIACLNINPIDKSTPHKSSMVAVGLWTEISVHVLSLPDLKTITKEDLGGEVIPRSVLFVTFDDVHYLLAALGDGQLFNFIFDPLKGILTEKKKLLLGTQPIMLTTFVSKGTINVFASSDRPTVIYSSNKKLLYSNVNTKEVTHMCPFNSASFPNSLVIAHEEGLTIGTIDDISKLHIRTIPLNEMPRRICYQESTSTFGVLTAQSFVNDERRCFFRILDDQTFEVLDRYSMDQHEMVQSLTTLKLEKKDNAPEFFAVGTAYTVPEDDDCRKGRLLIFMVEKPEQTQTRKLRLVSSLEVPGAVYSLAPLNERLVAGVNGRIMVFKLDPLTDIGAYNLHPLCNHAGYTLALHVVTRGDFIIVGDLMRSFQLLVYKPLEEKIEEIAKDFNTNWLTAIEAIDDDEFIGCDASYNLFTVHKNSDSTVDEIRRKLDEVGRFHLGDMVNRFRHGSLAMNLPESEPAATPVLLYCTVSGAIGVIATVSEKKFNFLNEVQKTMRERIVGVGGLKHKQWREFNNERRKIETENFLDGDLIESFLNDLSRKQMELIADDLEVTVEELFKTVEELTRVH